MTQGRNNPDGTYLKPKSIDQIDFPTNPLPYFPNDVQHATRWNLLIDAINAIRGDMVGEGGEVNTLANVGLTGEGLVEPKSGTELRVRSITAGSNVSVEYDAPNKTLIISAAAGASLPDSFAGVPGLIRNWDPQAMADAGHVNNEALSLLPDQSGSGNHGYMSNATYRPLLKTAQLNGRPIFDLTNAKAAITRSTLGKLTDNTTVFQVRQYNTPHIEHGTLNQFFTSAPDDTANPPTTGGNPSIIVQESTNVVPGFVSDRTAQFGGFYIDQDSRVWHILGIRITGHTTEWFYNDNIPQEVFNGTTGASVGFNVGFAGGWNGELNNYYTMGSGSDGTGGGGLNAYCGWDMQFGRALDDTEVLAVMSQLRVLCGI